jgi:hypothetical protein
MRRSLRFLWAIPDSLALGGMIGTTKHEIVLAVVGGLFVLAKRKFT